MMSNRHVRRSSNWDTVASAALATVELTSGSESPLGVQKNIDMVRAIEAKWRQYPSSQPLPYVYVFFTLSSPYRGTHPVSSIGAIAWESDEAV